MGLYKMLFGCSLNDVLNEISEEKDKKAVERVTPKILSKIAEVKKQNQINSTEDGIECTSQRELPPIPDSLFYNVVLEDGSRNIYNISRIVEKYKGIKYSEACALVKRGNYVVAEHVSFDEASSLCVKLQNVGGVAMMQKYEEQTVEREKARKKTEVKVELQYNDVRELSTVSHIPIPNGITKIGWQCFSEFKYLESVDIPDTVTEIGSDAFEKCTNLKKITIPDSVTEIGSNAFEGCTNLKAIIIPDSVTEIGSNAFEGCVSLEEIVLSNALAEIRYDAFRGCKQLKKIIIPDSVTEIGHNAFEGCANLEEIVLSNALTEIGYDAFKGCKRLKKISIPVSVKRIGSNAFSGCKSLESVHLAYMSGISGIFEDCDSLDTIVISNTVSAIADWAFNDCEWLRTVCIPSSVKSIGWRAFYDCKSLKSISIPDSVTEIGRSAFEGCKSLIRITIPDSVKTIGDYAFSGCAFHTIKLPSNLEDIGFSMFKGTPLMHLDIPQCHKLSKEAISFLRREIGSHRITFTSSR